MTSESSGSSPTGGSFQSSVGSVNAELARINEALKPTNSGFESAFGKDFVFTEASFEKETPPPPSPVSGASSLFDRNSEAIQRWANSFSADDELSSRLLELAKSIAIAETKAYGQDRKPGDWAREVARGNYKVGDWKCNVFFAEMALKTGMEPMYLPGKVFANTAAMLSGQSFRCWQQTANPKAGDAGVYPNHVFIVEDPKTGMGISALRTHVTEMKHFGKDKDGLFRPNPSLDPAHFSNGSLPEVIFFHYHCPDIRTKTDTTAM